MMMIWTVIWTLLQQPVVVQKSSNWPGIVVAIITGIPATIAAIVGGMALLQSRRNAEVAALTAVEVSEVKKETGVVSEKATEIHTLTNSNLSKVQSQLDVANAKIDGFNKAQGESARKIANMELLITSLIPPKGQPSPSQINGAKLDHITDMLGDVQHSTPPIAVVDEAVIKKLDEAVIGKLDTLQETVESPAPDATQPTEKASD